MRVLVSITLFLLAQTLSAQNQQPCSTEAHRQFDFWIGEWTVYKTGTDTLAGHNSVRQILGSCVIEENWTSATGWQGKSFNTYNPADSTWNQVWVDQSGATYHFSGRREGNVMQLYGEATSQKGENILFDFSFHYDPEKDTIRQLWKMSKDEGSNWQVIFDGTYVKE